MNPNTPPKLSFACPVKWDGMSGTERWKYCAQCGHHVANLSLLTPAERKALLERAREERICGTYYLRLSGEMVTPEAPLTPNERGRIRQFGAAALSAAALTLATGCVAPAKKATAQNASLPVATVPAQPPLPVPPEDLMQMVGVLIPFEVEPDACEKGDSENQGDRTQEISIRSERGGAGQ